MKVTVTKYLNVRVGAPTLNADCYQYLAPGSELEVDEQSYKGDLFDGVDTWLKDGAGNYYWSGGVGNGSASETEPIPRISPTDLFKDTSPQTVNYQDIINKLDPSWLKANGKDTTIVLIDTGVKVASSKFNINLVSETDITNGTSPDKDHGTFIAGILCGQGNEINGIANDAMLLSIRYKDANTPLDKQLDNMITAIDMVLKLKQINPTLNLCVNISQGLKNHQADLFPDKIKMLTDLIQLLVSKKVLVFCSAGENRDLIHGNLLFPSLLPEVISVGCITPDFQNRVLSNQVDFITPLQNYKSFNTMHEIITDNGSSFSVAIMSAISSLISSTQDVQHKAMFKSMLNPFQKGIRHFNFSDSVYEFFINT